MLYGTLHYSYIALVYITSLIHLLDTNGNMRNRMPSQMLLKQAQT